MLLNSYFNLSSLPEYVYTVFYYYHLYHIFVEVNLHDTIDSLKKRGIPCPQKKKLIPEPHDKPLSSPLVPFVTRVEVLNSLISRSFIYW